MDCCSHAVTRRRWMWGSVMASVGAMLGGGAGRRAGAAAAEPSDAAPAALEVLRKSISVDVHTHGGTTGITSPAPPSDDLAQGMRAGSLATACLADVPDGPILGRNAAGVLGVVRTAEPGMLYRYHLGRLDWLDEMVAKHGLRRALNAADLAAAHAAGQPAIVADVEGLDFLETKLERLDEAHQRGVRHLQLVHYTPNDIGDFQTGAIMHQGLTSFGAEVIRACHRLGFVCDVAHATEGTVKQAVKVASKPLLLSHTALAGSQAMGPTPLTSRQSAATTRARSPRPAARSASGTSSRASTNMSTVSKRWPRSSGSITSASAPTSRSPQAACRTTGSGCSSSRRCCAAASHPKRPERLQAAIICGSFVLRSADPNARSRFQCGSKASPPAAAHAGS